MIRLQDAISYLQKDKSPGQPNRANLTVVTANRLKFARLLRSLALSLDHSDEEILAAIQENALTDAALECGGKRIVLPQAALAYKDKKAKALFRKPSAPAKVANHFTHDTRNFALENGQVRSVHALLIVQFNSQTVTL
jgi:hypothetical protein